MVRSFPRPALPLGDFRLGILGIRPQDPDIPEGVLPGYRMLRIWGTLNLLYASLITFFWFLTYRGIPLPTLTKFFILSTTVWILMAIRSHRVPYRPPVALVLLLLLQIWWSIASFIAARDFGRSQSFTNWDFTLLGFGLVYLQARYLFMLYPTLLKKFMVGFLGLCCLSAFVGVLQTVGFGPAVAIGEFMVGIESITNWNNQGGVRAPGLFGNIFAQVNLLSAGAMMVASQLTWRRLTTWEFLAMALMLLGIVLVQSRGSLLPLGIQTGVIAVLFVRRYREDSVAPMVLAIAVVAIFFAAFSSKFTYFTNTVSGENLDTVEFRTDYLWPQAMNILRERPWVGIGIEPEFTGQLEIIPENQRWVLIPAMDSAVMIAGAFGGYPSIALLIAIAATAIAGLWLSSREAWRATTDKLPAAMGALCLAVYLSWNLWFGYVITNLFLTAPFVVILAMAGPTYAELNRRFRERFGFVVPNQTPVRL